MKDKHGQELSLGDRVVFVESYGSSPDPLIGIIIGFTRCTVKISYKSLWYAQSTDTLITPDEYSETKRISSKIIKI